MQILGNLGKKENLLSKKPLFSDFSGKMLSRQQQTQHTRAGPGLLSGCHCPAGSYQAAGIRHLTIWAEGRALARKEGLSSKSQIGIFLFLFFN